MRGLDERVVAQIAHRFLQFLTRVHDDRTVPCNGFLDRRARDQQEPNTIRPGLNRDLVACAKPEPGAIA